MMNKQPKIGIIGAGVNGVGTALALLQAFPYLQVTVYSDYFTPYTTGDGAAGFWSPYILPGTPVEKVITWSKATWDLFESWWKENKLGVFITPVRKVSKEEVPTPEWRHLPFNYREFTQEDLKEFGPEYISGHTYSAFVAEPTTFLPHLMEAVTSLGGRFQRRKVRRLEDLSDKADVIVNCAGIWSRDLVPDPKVYPVRGQMIRVRAPWINRCTFDLSEDSYAYIIPNSDTTVLGGTRQENDWRTTLDMKDRQNIWKNCTSLEPELKNAKIVTEWVGLRPARRGGTRLEEDIVCVNFKKIPVVHNYGHGGSGVTTFWGCSLEVKDLVGNILNRYYAPVYSKL